MHYGNALSPKCKSPTPLVKKIIIMKTVLGVHVFFLFLNLTNEFWHKESMLYLYYLACCLGAIAAVNNE